MRPFGLSVLGLLLCSSSAYAAKVQKILNAREIVILVLDGDELQKIKSGQNLTLHAGGGRHAEGEIKSISGTKAMVQVFFGLEKLKVDETVRLVNEASQTTVTDKAAVDGTKAPAPAAGLPPTPAAPPTPFAGEYTAANVVSAAQMNRVNHLQGNLAVGMVQSEIKAPSDVLDVEIETNGTAYEVGGVYHTAVRALVGLSIYQSQYKRQSDLDYKFPPSDGSFTVRGDESEVTLAAAYPVWPKTYLGAALRNRQIKMDTSYKNGADASGSETYVVIEPAALYTGDDYEVGLLYTPTININDDEDMVSERRPGYFMVHGAHLVTEVLSLNYEVRHVRYNRSEQTEKNTIDLTAGADLRFVGGRVGGELYYQPRFYRKKTAAGPRNIATYGLGLAGFVTPLPRCEFGLQAFYYMGRGEGEIADETRKITANTSGASLSFAYML